MKIWHYREKWKLRTTLHDVPTKYGIHFSQSCSAWISRMALTTKLRWFRLSSSALPGVLPNADVLPTSCEMRKRGMRNKIYPLKNAAKTSCTKRMCWHFVATKECVDTLSHHFFLLSILLRCINTEIKHLRNFKLVVSADWKCPCQKSVPKTAETWDNFSPWLFNNNDDNNW